MPKLRASKLGLVSGLSTIAIMSALDASAVTKDVNSQLPAANAVTPVTTTSAAAQATTPVTDSKQTKAADDLSNDQASAGSKTDKVYVHAGQELTVGTDSDGLVTTEDVELAKKQVASYPDNPEAHFILAVALTRTSYVEEALQEVRRARRLAQSQGGAQYFDKMIDADEKMLTFSPKENRVRYSLAWAYYMKAYLLAQEFRKPPQQVPSQTQISVPMQPCN